MSQFDTFLMFRYDTSEQKVTEKSRRYILQAFLFFAGLNITQKTVKKERFFYAEKAA